MRWMKQWGRWWAILTHEDRHLDPASLTTLLIIQQPGDAHAPLALVRCRARFPNAHLVVLTAQGWGPFFGQLRHWRRQPLSAVILLSLHPILVALACLGFRGPCLLFNRWGEWFLVRPRTLMECVTLRRGADRPYRPPATRLLLAPLRALSLAGYLGATLTMLFWRRWRFSQRP